MQVIPNVHLIPTLAVNVYLIADADGLTLIDAGLARTGRKILKTLAELGHYYHYPRRRRSRGRLDRRRWVEDFGEGHGLAAAFDTLIAAGHNKSVKGCKESGKDKQRVSETGSQQKTRQGEG